MKYYYTILETDDEDKFRLIFSNENNFDRKQLAVTGIRSKDLGITFRATYLVNTLLNKKIQPILNTKSKIEFILTGPDLLEIAPQLELEIPFNIRYSIIQRF